MNVLVAGVGNLFRRDDGFGSEVARQLAGRALPDDVKVVDYGIRGLHLAYDLLAGCDALVLVDAVPDRGAPGTLGVIRVAPEDLGPGELDAHGMDPGSVLASLARLGGRLPPTMVVGCQVADVDEGMGLSAAVAAAVQPAVELVVTLVTELMGELMGGRPDPPRVLPLPVPGTERTAEDAPDRLRMAVAERVS